MLIQRGHGAGLNIGGQAGFNPDTLLGQEVHQGAIFHRFYTVTDTLGTQFTDGLPDALRPRRFTGVNGNMPAGIACAVEM